MHNLYSGTAKRILNFWKSLLDPSTNKPLLTTQDFEVMGEQMKNIILPSGYDLPRGKVSSGCVNLTSDEWRTQLSPIKALDILKGFGRCPRVPSPVLRTKIEDFGPIYAFWLFGFERLNGLLKSIDTNSKDGFEVTFMSKYIERYYAADGFRSLYVRLSSRPSFIAILMKLIPSLATIESTSNEQEEPAFDVAAFDRFAQPNSDTTDLGCLGWEPLPPAFASLKMSEYIRLSSNHYDCLLDYYNGVYKDLCAEGAYQDNNKTMVVNLSSDIRGAYIQAYFDTDPETGGLFERPTLRPGLVQYYFTHMLRLPAADDSEVDFQHFFAFVRWYKRAAYDVPSFQPHGMRVWDNSFTPLNWTCILPVHQIYSPIGVFRWLDDNIVIIPLPRKLKG
ncbi:hypothetical protein VTP01DRAFT_3648 [Rhizomucor pusillus]|uniref:uncharacterized protein n=1 Tax=Rhizomucor pusillus TaxID=4840 RepID=UPI0037426C3F